MTDRPSLLSAEQDLSGEQMLERFLGFAEERGLDLYPEQEEAILEIWEGKNVILNTPTGSGKSLVAAAMHFRSLCLGRRSVYTCPIKALVNEKFIALCREFGPDNVGMSTGDATVNREAPILCCTAEILSNIALRHGADAPVDDVIMDEFHYYADRDRGVAWQVPLLCLSRARFLLMSATMSDSAFFQSELERLTGVDTAIVRSDDRPVPLEFVYSEESLEHLAMGLQQSGGLPAYLVHFTQRLATDTARNLGSLSLTSRADRESIDEQLASERFTSPFGKELKKMLRQGVGVHHAGMLPRYRRLVERLAQGNFLRIISGTDTLGVGINVPIRTVVFTSLAKYDGEKVGILSARDFHQIAGRAGRRGFDDHGTVIVQAPEHVIENRKREEKARKSSGKTKSSVRKKPPPGWTGWDEQTMNRLLTATAEALNSSFQVSHGMLLNVLSRPENGCVAMKKLIRDCHDTAGRKSGHRKKAMQLFRSLVEHGIVGFRKDRKPGESPVQVNIELQDDFSLNQTLSLFFVDAVRQLDMDEPAYPLLVLALAEAILENPDAILRRQVDHLKDRLNAQWKSEGIGFEERMERLLEVEHPKPFRDFIYSNFNEFAANHPWVGSENIQPKSIALEMYEEWSSFNDYIVNYGLARAEGLLLRHLSSVYRILTQTLPENGRTPEVDEIIGFLDDRIRQTDSSLLDEWERLMDPEQAESAVAETVGDPGPVDIMKHRNLLEQIIRRQIWDFVRCIAQRDFDAAARTLNEMAHLEVDGMDATDSPPESDRDGVDWRSFAERFLSERGIPLLDPAARNKAMTRILETPGERTWRIEQILSDREGFNDRMLIFSMDVDETRLAGKPVLHLAEVSPVDSP